MVMHMKELTQMHAHTEGTFILQDNHLKFAYYEDGCFVLLTGWCRGVISPQKTQSAK